MKPPPTKKTWRERVRPLTEALHPVSFTMSRVAQVVPLLQNPSLVGMAGLAAVGMQAVGELVYGSPTWDIDWPVQPAVTIDAFKRIGASPKKVTRHGAEHTAMTVHGVSIAVAPDGTLLAEQHPTPELHDWLRRVLDPALSPVIALSRGKGPVRYHCEPAKLAMHSTKQGRAIVESTRSMLDGGRCIMLEGKPGVGKTTMAQEIARELGLGRVAIIHASALAAPQIDLSKGPAGYSPPSAKSLNMLSAAVMILDDVDKMSLSLADLEELRASTKLLILTANNGKHDDVLDGAFMRAGRVDEVFTVEPAHTGRRAPFDRLNEEEWTEVSEWPVAYLNEVEKRLVSRPGELRLDDLRGRLTKRTRSGEVLR